TATRVQRSEDEFTGVPGWDDVAAFRVDDFEKAEVGVKMIPAGSLVHGARALAPSHLRFGETIRRHNVQIWRTNFCRKVDQLASHAVGNFLAAKHDTPKTLTAQPFFRRLMQYVVNECGHADQDVRFDFLNQAEI